MEEFVKNATPETEKTFRGKTKKIRECYKIREKDLSFISYL